MKRVAPAAERNRIAIAEVLQEVLPAAHRRPSRPPSRPRRRRGCHGIVVEQLLDGSDVVTIFQEMGGEGMAEGVGVASFLMPARAVASFTQRWIAVSCK